MSHHGREGNDLHDLQEALELARDGWARDTRRMNGLLETARERERELIGLLQLAVDQEDDVPSGWFEAARNAILRDGRLPTELIDREALIKTLENWDQDMIRDGSAFDYGFAGALRVVVTRLRDGRLP